MSYVSRTVLVVGGPRQSFERIKRTRAVQDSNYVHITEPRHLQGYCLKRGHDSTIDLTSGQPGERELLALAESVFR